MYNAPALLAYLRGVLALSCVVRALNACRGSGPKRFAPHMPGKHSSAMNSSNSNGHKSITVITGKTQKESSSISGSTSSGSGNTTLSRYTDPISSKTAVSGHINSHHARRLKSCARRMMTVTKGGSKNSRVKCHMAGANMPCRHPLSSKHSTAVLIATNDHSSRPQARPLNTAYLTSTCAYQCTILIGKEAKPRCKRRQLGQRVNRRCIRDAQ